jgi:hypothetical protein
MDEPNCIGFLSLPKYKQEVILEESFLFSAIILCFKRIPPE